MGAASKAKLVSAKEAKTLASKTCTWLSTREGKKALKTAVTRGGQLSNRLKEARKVNPESLRKPMGF